MIVFAAILAGLVIFFALWKRRNRTRESAGDAIESDSGGRGPHELLTNSNTPELLGKEKSGAGRTELSTEAKTQEINSKEKNGARGNELITKANTHEILGKEKTNTMASEVLSTEEMDAAAEVPAVPPKVPIPPPKHSIAPTAYELSHQTARPPELDSEFSALHEMDPQSQAQEVLPEWITRAELEAQRAIEIGGSPRDSRAESVSSPSSTRHSISKKPVGSPEPSTALDTGPSDHGEEETDKQEEARLAVLRDRIERIRADKERLEQIQRLSQLEEETKAEIMAAAQKRSRPK
jgi:hypothetical protein